MRFVSRSRSGTSPSMSRACTRLITFVFVTSTYQALTVPGPVLNQYQSHTRALDGLPCPAVQLIAKPMHSLRLLRPRALPLLTSQNLKKVKKWFHNMKV